MKIADLDIQQQAHALKKIEELKSSDGWSILSQLMKAEIETFYRQLSMPNAPTNLETVNYNRGIIEASYRLLELPDKLIFTLTQNVAMAKAQIAANTPPQPPASAGTP